jgi:hypothetical protein
MESLKAEIKALRDAQDKASKTFEDQQTASYQAAVSQIKTDVQRLVESDPEFETVKATRSVDDVVELITKTYEQDQVLMSVEDATREVENYLIEEALNLTRIQKIQKRLQAAQPEARVGQPQQQAASPRQQPMKTLTNAASSSRPLNARERAILAFKGELKS